MRLHVEIDSSVQSNVEQNVDLISAPIEQAPSLEFKPPQGHLMELQSKEVEARNANKSAN